MNIVLLLPVVLIVGVIAIWAISTQLEKRDRLKEQEFAEILSRRVINLSAVIRESAVPTFLDFDRMTTHYSLRAACASLLWGLDRKQKKALITRVEAISIKTGIDASKRRSLKDSYSIRFEAPGVKQEFHLREARGRSAKNMSYSPENTLKEFAASSDLVAFSVKKQIKILSETNTSAALFKRADNDTSKSVAMHVVLWRVHEVLFLGKKDFIRGFDSRPLPDNREDYLNDILSAVYKLNRQNLHTA